MSKARVHSFDPVADHSAEVLILGSMPGLESLRAGQYYAHSRNTFWKIMSELLDFDVTLPYAARLRALRCARIALWDVLHSCKRRGSLDSMIEPGSMVANDFLEFFRRHRRIRMVCFNGAKAEDVFLRQVLPQVGDVEREYRRLPSTSPANASYTHAEKLAEWRIVVAPQSADAGRKARAR